MHREHGEVSFGMVISLFLAACAISFGQGKITLRSEPERPLRSICRQMEGRLKWLITFEEPPFEHPDDLEDKAKPGSGATALTPRGKSFSFEFDEPLAPRIGERPVPDMAIMDRLLREYRKSGNWPFYGLRTNGRYSHITPSAVRDINGTIKAFVPMLDTRVAFPAAKRTLYDAVQLVLSKVSERRGIPIALGTYPNNFFGQSEVWIGADSEPARDVLIQLFGNANTKRVELGVGPVWVNWNLLYSPEAKQYFWNAHLVQ